MTDQMAAGWSIEAGQDGYGLFDQEGTLLAEHPALAPVERAAASLGDIEAFSGSGEPAGPSLERLLESRAFALLQRNDFIKSIKAQGCDPTGVDGPREDWMAAEISGLQRAVDRIEATALSHGWNPTCGS